MSISISVENLSKIYRLGQIGTGTISYDLERWFAKVRGKEDPFLKVGQTNNRAVMGDTNIVYSLKDINLEIKQGDAVGIMGKNGAGKSTLLKILSRVTSPTAGKIKINGRIASLLEVGTGFHPELTGRENIYLNGAILGMRKREIDKKFDEIVDFSGVLRYIDTPVKRYSSGMYVRLAFAVAAHLDSEILVIDEVLAVGDAEFQSKCISKMSSISKNDGRTILFVSHNIASIKNLCNYGVVLNNSSVYFKGNIDESISSYYSLINTVVEEVDLTRRLDRIGSGIVRINSISFNSLNNNIAGGIFSGDDIEINIAYFNSNKVKHENYHVGISVKTIEGVFVFSQNTRVNNIKLDPLSEEGVIKCIIKNIPLAADNYFLDVNIKIDEEFSDYVQNAAKLVIQDGDFFNTGRILPKKLGSSLVHGTWLNA